MLRTFAAVVLATSMITGTAFAAKPPTNGAATPAAAHVGSNAKNVVGQIRPSTTAKHMGKHTRKHVVSRTGLMHKTHFAKPTKGTKTAKTGRAYSANFAHRLTKTN